MYSGIHIFVYMCPPPELSKRISGVTMDHSSLLNEEKYDHLHRGMPGAVVRFLLHIVLNILIHLSGEQMNVRKFHSLHVHLHVYITHVYMHRVSWHVYEHERLPWGRVPSDYTNSNNSFSALSALLCTYCHALYPRVHTDCTDCL